jgi:hypothetical protein
MPKALTVKSRIAALLRVAGVVSLCTLVVLCWVGQRVHARGERVLQRFGDHMMRYAGADHQTVPQELTVNGASFYLSTGIVDASVPEVIDQFHAKCIEKNGQFHQQWAAVGKKHHVVLGKLPAIMDGVFRTSSDSVGIVACAEASDGVLSPELLISRLKQVLATGDLSKLGNLRYAYVTRAEQRSMFVAVWSEGPLNYRDMFPAQGDAPGGDPVGVPRPPGMRRVISTQPKNASAALNVYSSKQQHVKELLAFYADALPKAGFTLSTSKQRFLSAHDGKRMVTISLQNDASTGQGIATVATQLD